MCSKTMVLIEKCSPGLLQNKSFAQITVGGDFCLWSTHKVKRDFERQAVPAINYPAQHCAADYGTYLLPVTHPVLIL